MTNRTLKTKNCILNYCISILKQGRKFACMFILLSGISLISFAQRTLTIEQAMEIAEENNPNMKNSKLNYERTQLLLEAQFAGLKPQFSMSIDPFSYSQSRNFDNRYSQWYTNKSLSSNGTFTTELPILQTDGVFRLTNRFGWQNSESQSWDRVTEQFVTNTNKAWTNNLSLRYDQPLFTYNRRKMEMQRLWFDHENSGISYGLQRLRTEQSITRQFYSVYLAKNNLEISLAELKNAQTNYEIVNSKVEASLSAKEELYQAEVNLANARSSVQSYDVSLKNAKDDLKQTLGIPLSEEIDVSVSIEAVPMLIDEEKAILSGLASRMELRQREISMDLADLTMITIKAMNEFKGDITLSMSMDCFSRSIKDSGIIY